MTYEPKLPRQPGKKEGDCGDFGRIVSEGFMFHIWHCRWCGGQLGQDGAAVICAVCDRADTQAAPCFPSD